MSAQQLWMNWGLDCGGPNGTARPSLSNAVRVLERDPALMQHIWYDEFLDRILTGSPPREWRDADDLNLTVDFQDRLGLATIQVRTITDAVQQFAHRRPRHVVREWLSSLTWDGEPRIAMAFEDHWGVLCDEGLPCEYVRAASRNFFVGLIARVMQPGCKLDTMPVFEGSQGIYKSSALEILGGAWYADARETMGTKDFLVSLQGKWLVEISELHAFSKAEVTAIKQTMSTRIDRYRPPYGRAAMDFPRQCAFAGTTNGDQWGTDETGLRRFWPVRCGDIYLSTLRGAREQLFAEAMTVYRDEGKWWEMPSGTGGVQSDRHYYDEWSELVESCVIGKSDVSILEVLQAMKVPTERIDVACQRRIGRLLKLAGRKRRKVRMGTATYWRWFLEE